jgi:hypothetical protein
MDDQIRCYHCGRGSQIQSHEDQDFHGNAVQKSIRQANLAVHTPTKLSISLSYRGCIALWLGGVKEGVKGERKMMNCHLVVVIRRAALNKHQGRSLLSFLFLRASSLNPQTCRLRGY